MATLPDALPAARGPAASGPRAVWRRLGRELRVALPLCTGIGLFLHLVFRDGLWLNLAYSLCIGLTIQALVQVGRFGFVRLLQRRRPDDPALARHWPGWPVMVPWVLVSAVLGYALGALLAGALTGTTHLRSIAAGNLGPLAVAGAVSLIASLGMTWVFWLRGRLDATEARAQASRREAAEAQLRLLQSQLEPHMLFNTLANLRVLIGLDPVQAQAMLDRLIGFLRATLSASRSDAHPLSAEFERIADYLALMAVRMGPRLQVVLDLPDALRDRPVPPLLLQPLVENAILHGLEPHIAGGRLELRAQALGGRLRLTVRDTGAGLRAHAAPAGGGFGTAQVRERLATRYGTAARFTLGAPDDGGPGTLATVELPLEP